MPRDIDLGPRSSDPVGVIRRAATPAQMTVSTRPRGSASNPWSIAVIEGLDLIKDRAVWRVVIRRDGYELNIRTRKDMFRALGVATILSMGTDRLCFDLIVQATPSRVGMLQSILASAELARMSEFIRPAVIDTGLRLFLTNDVLAGGHDAVQVEVVFRDLCDVDEGQEI